MMAKAGAHSAQVRVHETFSRLKEVVIGHTGLAYYDDKDDVLASRVEKRIAERGCRDCGVYLDLISGPDGAEEFDALISELTVGETFFFRYAEQYDALRELVFPDILRRNRHTQRLRVWSAGCSNGAEAYSVAILLRRAFGALLQGWDISIIGTDINREYLSQANAAEFSVWSLRDLPADIRDGCFVSENGHWTLKAPYREWVSFQYHNLIRHAVPSIAQNLAAFDVILCRNVMIYFAPAVIDELIQRFKACMSEGAWLLVGHAETMPQLNSLFLPVSVPGATVYQKRQSEMQPRHATTSGVPTFPENLTQLLSPVTPRLAGLAGDSPGPEAARESILRGIGRKTAGKRQVVEGLSTGRQGLPNFIERMIKLANMGELDAAAALCQDLLSRTPADPNLHFFLGVISAQLDQPHAAENALKLAIALRAQPFALAHYHLGLLHQSRQPEQAKQDFVAALESVVDLDGDMKLEGGDGMRVADLVEVASLQLELLSRS